MDFEKKWCGLLQKMYTAYRYICVLVVFERDSEAMKCEKNARLRLIEQSFCNLCFKSYINDEFENSVGAMLIIKIIQFSITGIENTKKIGQFSSKSKKNEHENATKSNAIEYLIAAST